MRHAGFRSATALSIYYFIRVTGMLVLPGIALSLPLFDSSLSFRAVLPYALGAFAFGMVVPSFILDKLVEKRQRIIRNSLPDALDLLVITTEAGLGLNGALVRVASEIRGIHLILADELDMINAELQAGVDRDRALRNFYARTGVEEVKSLVGLINQSLKFGTSVASSLRMYADEFRQKRMQKAQEMAAKLGTKMIFPLAFCFMPCFFIVAVGPAVLKAIKVFSGP